MKQLVEQELQKMSQSELARRMHVSQSTIHKILYTETKQSIPTIQSVSRYFKLPITYFIENEGEAPQTALANLSNLEQQLLLRYRYLSEKGQGKIVYDYIDFMAEKNGFSPKKRKKDNVVNIS